MGRRILPGAAVALVALATWPSLADEKPDLAKRMYDDMTAYFARFGWDEGMIVTEKRKGRKRRR